MLRYRSFVFGYVWQLSLSLLAASIGVSCFVCLHRDGPTHARVGPFFSFRTVGAEIDSFKSLALPAVLELTGSGI